MSKRIAFCADGTWDNSTPIATSICFHKSLMVIATRYLFMTMGWAPTEISCSELLRHRAGLQQKVKDGYTKIAHVYEEGDQIFIFGFSRGAYTAGA